ncbi:MAG: DNA polymerase III subunit gamma/tau [Bacteroidetes bacterium]|nr:DNA polymerase III subunit gamma/tau [Bacteroidota bacterium]
MDSFVVSARKYRPQDFSTVVGQSHITTTLKNAIRQQKLAHAFLFCGPRGVGKTTCARILAKTVNCEQLGPNGEACNTCTSCTTFNAGASFNIHELDAASNNSVDDIRELTDQVRFHPQAGKYKVYIIDEVHMLSTSAFNAFLKTLEEPPPYAIFILATTEKHKILPTILSRCQIFDFKRITDADTVAHLEDIAAKEGIHAEKGALQVIAQKSEGCMRDALSTLDKIVSFTNGSLTYASTLEHMNILDEDVFFRFLSLLQAEDLAGSLLLYDEVHRKGFDGETLLGELATFFRNLMVCQDPRTHGLLEVVESFRPRYGEVAAKTSLPWLIGAVHLLTEALQTYREARNKKLHVELLLVKLAYLSQAVEWSSDDPDTVKKKRVDGRRVIGFRSIPRLGPSLIIQDTTREKDETPSPTPPAAPVAPTPRPQPIEQSSTASAANPTTPRPDASGIGTLNKLRERILARGQAERKGPIPLSEELLQDAWERYIQQATEQNNHTIAANLRNARHVITSAHSFEIVTDTNLQHRFIEQERGGLIEHLQAYFNNRTLTYQVVLEAPAEPADPAVPPLTRKEQYQRMSEAFPLVRQLKERLGLDLE